MGGPEIVEESKPEPIQWSSLDVSKSELLRNWDFDVWSYKEEQLYPLIIDMFNDFGLLERFNINREKFQNFLNDVRSNYSRKNPYHNFRHAFDVTQTVYLLLTNAQAASHLSYLEIFAALVAGIVHDLAHPGLNNNYQIATQTALALRYNDRSVLENHHCFMCFQLLR